MAKKVKLDKATGTRGRCFLIYARPAPTEKNPEPKIVAARVYAPNAVFARSRFWKLNLRHFKLRRTQAQLLKVQEIFEKDARRAKNYGIYLKYRSHVGIHNTFKEYRDTTANGAIEQMYSEMAGNHKARRAEIEILNVKKLAKEELRERKPRCLIWEDQKEIQYPLWKRNVRPTHAKYTSLFHTKRPVVMKTGKTVSK